MKSCNATGSRLFLLQPQEALYHCNRRLEGNCGTPFLGLMEQQHVKKVLAAQFMKSLMIRSETMIVTIWTSLQGTVDRSVISHFSQKQLESVPVRHSKNWLFYQLFHHLQSSYHMHQSSIKLQQHSLPHRYNNYMNR